MLPRTRAGVTALGAFASFAPPSEHQIGNNRPPWTGSHSGPPDRPAPSQPSRHPGYIVAGETGDTDGFSGADPGSPGGQLPANPRRVVVGAEQENSRRYGIQGFNDQLQVRDRHAFFKRGTQRFGSTPSVPGNPPNPQSDGPAMPGLHTVNRSVNPQIGSSASRNQDDLTRPYTWLGQQDGTVVPVYGGVPGLWQSYGNRGLAQGIHDPTNGEGGLVQVRSGPPHGLHSDTIPDGKQLGDRYKSTPQMRPVRQDRPSNSKIAGQSYSQTVQMQGGSPAQQAQPRRGFGLNLGIRAGG